MEIDVTIPAALVAGLLSFLSPCVLPLAPAYLVYLAGASAGSRRSAIGPASLFVLGFSTVFVALGATASMLGAFLTEWADWLAIVAGVFIILMGLHFLGLLPIGLLMREKRVQIRRPAGLLSAYAMGLAFAFGWTPCIGPVLGAILAVAASEATMSNGVILLSSYSLGLALPFLLAALFVQPFTAFLVRFRAHLPLVEKAMGGLLVLTGVAFLTGLFGQASYWLLQTFPALERFA
jgi:cytochrome c-type biogenesis protein